eukprot:335703_1
MASKNGNKAVYSNVIKREILVTFPEPSSDVSVDPEAAEKSDLACIYRVLPIMSKHIHVWSMEVSWFGEEHIQEGYKRKKSVYDESIILLLNMCIWPLFQYLNEIHHLKPSFSLWFISKCTPSPYALRLNQFVYVEGTSKYIHIRDAIPEEQCYIYPGYEDIAVGSGFEVNLAESEHNVAYKNNEIIYVHNSDSLIVFGGLSAMHFGSIRCDSRAAFINILRIATEKKIRVNKEPFTISGSYPMVRNFVGAKFCRCEIAQQKLQLLILIHIDRDPICI